MTAIMLPLHTVEDWMDRGICAQTDAEAFFPEKGQSTREAKRVCLGCDVRPECLTYALEHDERFGVWGGLSERERRKVKRGDLSAIEKLTNPPPLRECTNCGKTLYDRGNHLPGGFCNDRCRSQFKYYNPRHGTLRRYRHGCQCVNCVRALNDWVELKRGEEIRRCANCGGQFVVDNGGRKYCSTHCRRASDCRERRERRRALRNIVCTVCGTRVGDCDPRVLYCSAECRAQARNARRRDAARRIPA